MKLFNGDGALKRAGLIFGIITAIVVFGWKMDDRYAKAGLEKKVEENKEFYQTSLKQLDLKIQLQRRLTTLYNRLYRLKDLIRKYPNDVDLEEEKAGIEEKIKKLEEKIGNL